MVEDSARSEDVGGQTVVEHGPSSQVTDAAWRDANEAIITPYTESELAEERLAAGGKLVQYRGRWWQANSWGFYFGLHQLARFGEEEIGRPSIKAVGYRGALTDESAGYANATMPTHLLADVDDYSPAGLSSNRRYHLRKCRKNVDVVQVLDPEVMAGQGYDVFSSAQERTDNPYRAMWSRETFVARRRDWVGTGARITLAGMIDGRMGGYVAGYAVGSTAYLEIVDIATEALKSHVSTCLHMAFIEACQRSPDITEIVHSPHIPEQRALGTYKIGMGFSVVHVPVRLSMLPPVRLAMKRYRPFVHYRLTGEENAAVRAAIDGDQPQG